MIEVPPFCDNWSNYRVRTDAERAEYVAEEMRRIQQDRGPLLRAILSCAEESAQRIALQYLSGALTPSGEQPIIPGVWLLRLRDGASPPARDPQGRALPKEIAGKVLRAKVGNVVFEEGKKRKVADQHGRNLYILRDITSTPQPIALSEALVILRAWGYGVARETDRQLVEEVDLSALSQQPAPKPRERDRAAA